MRGPTLFATALILVGLLVGGYTFLHAVVWAPDSSGASAVLSQDSHATGTSSYPAQLRIPALSIRAGVKYVGTNAEGNMATPGNFTDVAWYKFGTVPGNVGSAVMDGHVDNGLGLPGVFKHLSDIKVGDDIYVDTRGGNSIHFVVRDIEAYPYQSVPVEQVFNAHDVARLNLVTCEGVWVAGQKTYDHRLVVYAVRAS